MRLVGMATRDELLVALTSRYGKAGRADKARILAEFVALAGYHRKHAAQLLRGGSGKDRSAPRPRRRLYDDAVREALIMLWEASDRICGKRLKPLIPGLVAAMERHGHLALDPAVRERLVAISAATIDRILTPVRKEAGGHGRRRRSPSSEIRRAVPIRTYADWNDPPPGFFEADLVSHSGPLTRGSFAQTLVLTPHQRLVADPRKAQALKNTLDDQYATLDPASLLRDIRAAQRALIEVADTVPVMSTGVPPLEAFLESLKVAWRSTDEVRPTAQPKPSKPRHRTVPDPLEAVTEVLKAWFDADPGVTGRQLLDRLQVAHPGAYPDCLVRTVQRRLKIRRRESARALVLGRIDTVSASGGLSGEALHRLTATHPAGKPPAPTGAPMETVALAASDVWKPGNIPNEATATASGTFLYEAIRGLHRSRPRSRF